LVFSFPMGRLMIAPEPHDAGTESNDLCLVRKARWSTWTVMPIPKRIEGLVAESQPAEVVRRAFQKACDVLQLKMDTSDPLTDLVMREIVELVKAGDFDPERVCHKVLIGISEQLGSPEVWPDGGYNRFRGETERGQLLLYLAYFAPRLFETTANLAASIGGGMRSDVCDATTKRR
jgi:hypothetical protein